MPDLIEIGASYGWLVRLNSNGSMTDRIFAETLVKAGLNVVDISLYSPHPETHDQMRGSRGLWRKATKSIEVFAALQKQYRDFQVITQTLLCRENYADFADLLRLHYQLGSNGIVVSYLEGDFEKKHLLTRDEIQYFRAEILPNAQAVVEELHPHVRDIARRIVGSLFSEATLDAAHWAEGIYRPTLVPCKLCPMNLHVFIPLRPGNRWITMAKYWLNKLQMGHLEQKIYPLIRRYRANQGGRRH